MKTNAIPPVVKKSRSGDITLPGGFVILEDQSSVKGVAKIALRALWKPLKASNTALKRNHLLNAGVISNARESI